MRKLEFQKLRVKFGNQNFEKLYDDNNNNNK